MSRPQFAQTSVVPSDVSPQLVQRLPMSRTADRSVKGALSRPSRMGMRAGLVGEDAEIDVILLIEVCDPEVRMTLRSPVD